MFSNKKGLAGNIKRLSRNHEKISKQLAELTAKMVDMRVDEQESMNKLEKRLGDQMNKQKITAQPARKTFVIMHTFDNVSTMKDEEEKFSPSEEHFGVNWKMCLLSTNEHRDVYLQCDNKEEDSEDWSIEINEIVLVKLNGKIMKMETGKSIFHQYDDTMGYDEFMKWDDFKEGFGDHPVTVEYHVEILKMEGIVMWKLQKYRVPTANLTDVVLKVGEEKFHVSKQCLANHCEYFENLFYHDYVEKGKGEVELRGNDPVDFQNFLDVVYGELSIEESTVEGILLYESVKGLKKKYEMSIQYKMGKLTKYCISQIKDMKIYDDIVSDTLHNAEAWVTQALVRKSIELTKEYALS